MPEEKHSADKSQQHQSDTEDTEVKAECISTTTIKAFFLQLKFL